MKMKFIINSIMRLFYFHWPHVALRRRSVDETSITANGKSQAYDAAAVVVVDLRLQF